MEFIDKQLKKNSNPGLFVASIIMSFLLLALLVWPKYGAYQANQKTLTDAQAENAKLTEEKASVITAISDMENNAEDVSKADQAIPSSQDNADLYALIENLAQSANLKLGNIQTSDALQVTQATAAPATGTGAAPTAGSPTASTSVSANTILPSIAGTTEMNIEVVGAIDGFNQFLSSIENSLRIIDVESIDVSSVQERPGQSTFRVGLKTYYQK